MISSTSAVSARFFDRQPYMWMWCNQYIYIYIYIYIHIYMPQSNFSLAIMIMKASQVSHASNHHCSDVIIGAIATQITSLTVVYSTVYSSVDQRKHQSSVSLAFVWGIHQWAANSPHKWPVMRKMHPFMTSSCMHKKSDEWVSTKFGIMWLHSALKQAFFTECTDSVTVLSIGLIFACYVPF